MAKALAIIALLSLIISLSSTIIAIWLELAQKDDLMQLTERLLSWQVIAGGLAFGAGHTFRNEIKNLLDRFHQPGNHVGPK
jgi:hypothetical protein